MPDRPRVHGIVSVYLEYLFVRLDTEKERITIRSRVSDPGELIGAAAIVEVRAVTAGTARAALMALAERLRKDRPSPDAKPGGALPVSPARNSPAHPDAPCPATECPCQRHTIPERTNPS